MHTPSHYNQESGRSNLVILVGVAVAIIVALGIFLAITLSRSIDTVILNSLVKPIASTVQAQARTHLFMDGRFYNWDEPMSEHHFNEFFNEIKTLGTVQRVNIFNKDKVLEFSTVREDVGRVVIDPAIDRALHGELVLEMFEREDLLNGASGNVIKMHIPAGPQVTDIQGVVSVYMDDTELFAFRNRLYLLVFLFGLSSIVTVAVVIYVGFRRQSIMIENQAKELSTIIDKAPIGIYIVNKKGIVEVFNPKMVEFAGAQNSSEVVGLNVFELSTYKDVGLDAFLKRGFDGESLEKEFEYTSHITGRKMWRRYHGVPLTDASGKNANRLLLIVEDITQGKHFERELEQTVADRTKELYEKIDELEKFKVAMIGRELKMIELKKIIKEQGHTEASAS